MTRYEFTVLVHSDDVEGVVDTMADILSHPQVTWVYRGDANDGVIDAIVDRLSEDAR